MLAIAVAESIVLPAMSSNTKAGEDELRGRVVSSTAKNDGEWDLMLTAEFLSSATNKNE